DRTFFFQAEDGIRDRNVTGVQTCALPIWLEHRSQVNASLRLWRLRREACLCQDRRSAAMEGCIRNIDLRQNQNNCYEQELKHKHRPRPACHGCPKRKGDNLLLMESVLNTTKVPVIQ